MSSLKGQKQYVQLLLTQGAPVNNINGNHNNTPLHAASSKGHEAVMQVLRKNGADVNKVNKIGWTVLHIAVYSHHIEAVELLLKHGAQVNIKNNRGFTPLEFARVLGEEEMRQLLLSYQKKDKEGNTCFHQALKENDLGYAASLIRCGMDPQVTNQQSHTPLRLLSDQLPKYFAPPRTVKSIEEKHGLSR